MPPRLLPDGRKMPEQTGSPQLRIDPQPIIQKLTEENQDVKRKLIAAQTELNNLSGRFSEFEKASSNVLIQQVSGVDIFDAQNIIVHVKLLDGQIFSLMVTYAGHGDTKIHYYDPANNKINEPYKTNPATMLVLYHSISEAILRYASSAQENAALVSELSSTKSQLETRLSELNMRVEESKHIAVSDSKKVEEVVSQHKEIEKQLRASAEAQKQESLVMLGESKSKISHLETILGLASRVQLERNGFFIEYEQDGRKTKLQINEDGIYEEESDGFNVLPEGDSRYELFKLFGKHYAVFASVLKKQEDDLSQRLSAITEKELELLRAMNVEEGKLNVTDYASPYEAAFGLFGILQTTTVARQQSRAKFMSGIHTAMGKLASDAGIKQILPDFEKQWGANSLAAVEYVLAALPKNAKPMSYDAANLLRNLAERVEPNFVGELNNFSGDELLKIAVKSIMSFIKSSSEEAVELKNQNIIIQKSWADYISKLSGSKIDVGVLENNNAGQLQNLLAEAIKTKQMRARLSIIMEIFENMPAGYASADEIPNVEAGLNRLAAGLKQLASDAQTNKENSAALTVAKEQASQLLGDLESEKEKSVGLEARLDEARTGNAEAESAKIHIIGLEADLKVAKSEAELASRDASAAKTVYEPMIDMLRQIAAGKDALLEQKDREIKRYEQQLSEKDAGLAEQKRRLEEKEQQVQSLSQELRASKAQTAEAENKKGKVKKVSVILPIGPAKPATPENADKKGGEEKIPEMEISEETDQMPPAV